MILTGALSDGEAKRVAKALADGTDMVDASLSMRTFLYDALLLADRERYASFVLDDIAKIYEPMLKCGNNTVWETVLGAADFSDAGSLCHGWSAIPIYYYNILK